MILNVSLDLSMLIKLIISYISSAINYNKAMEV